LVAVFGKKERKGFGGMRLNEFLSNELKDKFSICNRAVFNAQFSSNKYLGVEHFYD
jgi:hypothetical protein